jgi:hypothetical protein
MSVYIHSDCLVYIFIPRREWIDVAQNMQLKTRQWSSMLHKAQQI